MREWLKNFIVSTWKDGVASKLIAEFIIRSIAPIVMLGFAALKWDLVKSWLFYLITIPVSQFDVKGWYLTLLFLLALVGIYWLSRKVIPRSLLNSKQQTASDYPEETSTIQYNTNDGINISRSVTTAISAKHPITDKEDIFIKLHEWWPRSTELYPDDVTVEFEELERLLNLESGSVAKYIVEVAVEKGYVVKRQGSTSILFNYDMNNMSW